MRSSAFVLLAVSLGVSGTAQAAFKCNLNGSETILMHRNIPTTHPLPPPPFPSSKYVFGGLNENDPWPLVNSTGPWEPDPAGIFMATGWQVGATGDFDGDGTCDLAATMTTAKGHGLAISLTDTTVPPPYKFDEPARGKVVPIDVDWTLVGSGDFIKEGLLAPTKAELVFWDPTPGEVVLWPQSAPAAGAVRRIPRPEPNWMPQVVANLDGSGLPEIIWRQGTATALRYTMYAESGTTYVQLAWAPLPQSPADANWLLRGAADVDHDNNGIDDLIFQNDALESQRTVVWFMGWNTVTGPYRLVGNFTAPDQLIPPGITLQADEKWLLVGPR
jgi:hypothetical protein